MNLKSPLKFIAVGSIFSASEEFLTVVLLRGDWPSYIFTLLILFPVFLTLVFYLNRLLNRITQTDRTREFIHYWFCGTAGLMIEWLLIGLSPWSDPNAHLVLMPIFQLGMFSFWATVGFAPRLILNSDEISRKIGRSLLKFYIGYFAIVYIVAFSLPREKRFGPVISLIIIGYLFLNWWYLRYFRLRFCQPKN